MSWSVHATTLRLRLAACALVLLGSAACHRRDRARARKAAAASPAAVAELQAAVGAVTLQPAGAAQPAAAAAAAALTVGDVLSTGPQSSATVHFRAGPTVKLGPDSSLVIRAIGAAATNVGAVLLKGGLHAEGAGQGALLSIGTPFGTLSLGAVLTVLDVTVDGGAKVSVGEVAFDRGDGKPQVVAAGQDITIAGLQVAHAAPAAAMAGTPMPMTLFARPGQARLAAGPGAPLKPVSRRAVVHEGDRLQLGRGKVPALLQVGDAATLSMRGAGGVDVVAARSGDGVREAQYVLHGGDLRLSLSRQPNVAARHVVEVGHVRLAVTPGEREADCEVNLQGDHARVSVRMGRVKIDDGTTVEAGSQVDLFDGKASAPRPLAANRVRLEVGRTAVVFADKKPPPLEFYWSAPSAAQPTVLEVATDAGFRHIVAAEEVSRGSLIIDRLPVAHYFWRTGRDAATSTSLDFRPEHVVDCPRCRRDNVIDDTGEKTVVMFQKELPSIALRWKAVEGAASYAVKVFADGAFDRPLAQATQAGLEKTFPAGQFAAGKYLWLTTALDSAGRELAPGRMNTLQIAYDNAITGVMVRTPKSGAQVVGGEVRATGVAEPDAELSINGQQVELDDDGHFETVLPVHRGNNLLVFTCLGRDGVARHYLRPVFRR